MTTRTGPIETLGDLATLPNGGVGQDVIEAWIERFQHVLGEKEMARDFPLTSLQRRVANDPEAFGRIGPNLVVTGPTSAGKTLAAEMLIANHLHRASQPLGCIYAVPLRALATEKYERFLSIFGRAGVYVSSSDYQDFDQYILRQRFRITVVVYEKLYAWLLDRLHAGRILSQTGLLIVDELQMLTDAQRGPKLELLLTFVRDYQRRSPDPGDARLHLLRIIGLGPSESGLGEVTRWLDARPISIPDDQRPVPLIEGYLRSDGTTYTEPLPAELAAALPGGRLELPRPRGRTRDELTEDFVVQLLSAEGGRLPVGVGKRILVYCATKEGAERMAQSLASALGHRQQLNAETREQMASLEGTTALAIFRETLSSGVAFHHGDLTLGERKLVEDLFREAAPTHTKLDVVVCTPTLGMGVNLPADYMLFPTTDTYRQAEWMFKGVTPQPLSPLEYKNFAGRAGRYRPNAPQGHHGVALFITDKDEESAQRDLLEGLIRHPVDPIEPSLHRWPYGLAPLAVAAMAWENTNYYGDLTPERIKQVFSRTFAGHRHVTVWREVISPERVGLPEVSDVERTPAPAIGTDVTPVRIEEAAVEAIQGLSTDHPELVKKVLDDRYNLPAAGKVLAETGIHVRTFEVLERIARSLPDILDRPLVILEELVQAPEAVRLYPTRVPDGSDARRLASKLRSFFGQYASTGGNVGPIAQDLLTTTYVPDADSLAYLMRTVAAWLWMQGESTESLPRTGMLPDIRYGAVAMLTDQLAWFMGALPEVWAALGAPGIDESAPDDEQDRWEEAVKNDIRRFEWQLRYGVPDALTTVAHLRVGGLHRERLMELWDRVGPWDHPVRLLDSPQTKIPPQVRPLFRQLKRRIRTREWKDDPRSIPQRQLSLVRQALDNDYPVDARWGHIVTSLHAAAGQELVDCVRQAIESRPLLMDIDDEDPKLTGRATISIRRPGSRYVGIEVVGTLGETVTWSDIIQRAGRLGPDRRIVSRLICVIAGEIGDLESEHQRYEGALMVVSREAFVHLCARAVDGPEDVESPERRSSAVVRVRHILLEGRAGIFRTADDVDREVDRQGGEARVIGAQVGRGARMDRGAPIVRTEEGRRPDDVNAKRRERMIGILNLFNDELDFLPQEEEVEYDLVERLRQVVRLVPDHSRESLRDARSVLESIMKNALEVSDGKHPTGDLYSWINALKSRGTLDAATHLHAHTVRNYGNKSSHPVEVIRQGESGGLDRPLDVTPEDAISALPALVRVSEWYLSWRRRLANPLPLDLPMEV